MKLQRTSERCSNDTINPAVRDDRYERAKRRASAYARTERPQKRHWQDYLVEAELTETA